MITSCLIDLRALAGEALKKNDSLAWRMAMEKIKDEIDKLLKLTKKGW